MSSGFVGKKVSHQRIKVAELTANPEDLKKFVAHGEGKYVLTQVVAGKDWGIGTIWKLVQDTDGPVLARVFDGTAPEGLRIINEGAVGNGSTKTASLHVPAEDATERLASGIALAGESSVAVEPIVLDWVEGGWVPASPAHVAGMADAQLKAGKIGPEEANQIKAQASKLYPVVLNYADAKAESLFGAPSTTEAGTSSLDRIIASLAQYKPKAMSWGKFASALKNLLASVETKQAGEIPPQFLKNVKDKKDEKPGEKKDDKGEKKDAKPGEKKDDKKPADKKDDKGEKKDEGKKLPPWLQ